MQKESVPIAVPRVLVIISSVSNVPLLRTNCKNSTVNVSIKPYIITLQVGFEVFSFMQYGKVAPIGTNNKAFNIICCIRYLTSGKIF